VSIGTADQFQPNSGVCNGTAQGICRGENLRTGVVIDAWKNVRCTRCNFDPVSDRETRHLQSRLKIGRSVIQSGKKVTMKVDHRSSR